MEYIRQHRWIQIALLAVIVLMGIAIWQSVILHKAHSSFDNYAAFRGCTQVLTRAATEGTCRLASGEIITIVQFQDRWYLKDDLPLFSF